MCVELDTLGMEAIAQLLMNVHSYHYTVRSILTVLTLMVVTCVPAMLATVETPLVTVRQSWDYFTR